MFGKRLGVRELRGSAIGSRVKLLRRWLITYTAAFAGGKFDRSAILFLLRPALPEPLEDGH